MKIVKPSFWPGNVEEAIAVQEKMRKLVIREDQLGSIKYVAGVDVGYDNKHNITQAAAVVLSFPELKLKDRAIARLPTTFPYIPGLLSFREIPAILDALEKLIIVPDLILCDGQGLIHPRRFGLACHLGVLIDAPTIGVGKSPYIGSHATVLKKRGNWQALREGEETIGAVLRNRTGVKPIYVSTGHKISLTTAIHYVLKCSQKYRLPETTRWADRLASSFSED